MQETFATLKARHAERLREAWDEPSDPAKRVLEDLGIAAWLIAAWTGMYAVPAAATKRGPGRTPPGVRSESAATAVSWIR